MTEKKTAAFYPMPAGCRDMGGSVRLSDVAGFRTASVHAGLKTAAKKPHDLALLYAEDGAVPAAVFTTNLFKAAPVLVSRKRLRSKSMKAVITNAGNANCATGKQGLEDAEATCAAVAECLGCRGSETLVASTGIIGEKLPMEKILPGVKKLCSAVKRRKNTGDFSKAILTTDTRPKRAGVECTAGDGTEFRIAGCVKGSGMIAPNMATMLAYVVTDLLIEKKKLQRMLAESAKKTFNRVTVDGDTSTNDTVFLLSSLSGTPASDRATAVFRKALDYVCGSLAFQIAADGEGATRTALVFVGGARSERDAEKAAYAIAHSPLVKTALAGGDPNWGRIVAAAGRSGARFDPAEISVTMGKVQVFRAGEPTGFNRKVAEKAVRAENVPITVMLGNGPGSAFYLTCDFSHGYVTINADYHT